MKQLQLFTNEEFGEMRGIEIEGKPYVVANDVLKSLGYAEGSWRTVLSRKCKGVTKCNGLKVNGTEINLIPEGDVYRLIFSSKLPSAQKFEEWVMDEVLPEIRKTGGYIDEGATTQQLEQLQHKITKLLNYKIKGDTINDVCSATGLRRKDIKQYLFDNDWVVEYNGAITNYDYRYIFIVRHKDIHFTSRGLDKILKDLQPLKPVRPLINKELYRK
jgi:prophage antirepressor-like protein|nr:MAG TPA: repressor domain protein [Caudoviricetes sp.]